MTTVSFTSNKKFIIFTTGQFVHRVNVENICFLHTDGDDDGDVQVLIQTTGAYTYTGILNTANYHKLNNFLINLH